MARSVIGSQFIGPTPGELEEQRRLQTGNQILSGAQSISQAIQNRASLAQRKREQDSMDFWKGALTLASESPSGTLTGLAQTDEGFARKMFDYMGMDSDTAAKSWDILKTADVGLSGKINQLLSGVASLESMGKKVDLTQDDFELILADTGKKQASGDIKLDESLLAELPQAQVNTPSRVYSQPINQTKPQAAYPVPATGIGIGDITYVQPQTDLQSQRIAEGNAMQQRYAAMYPQAAQRPPVTSLPQTPQISPKQQAIQRVVPDIETREDKEAVLADFNRILDETGKVPVNQEAFEKLRDQINKRDIANAKIPEDYIQVKTVADRRDKNAIAEFNKAKTPEELSKAIKKVLSIQEIRNMQKEGKLEELDQTFTEFLQRPAIQQALLLAYPNAAPALIQSTQGGSPIDMVKLQKALVDLEGSALRNEYTKAMTALMGTKAALAAEKAGPEGKLGTVYTRLASELTDMAISAQKNGTLKKLPKEAYYQKLVTDFNEVSKKLGLPGALEFTDTPSLFGLKTKIEYLFPEAEVSGQATQSNIETPVVNLEDQFADEYLKSLGIGG